MTALSDLDGQAAPPRRNGELAFDEPWQGRAFGVAAALVAGRFGGDWEPFRQRLITAIADSPGQAYWESWATALERLATDHGLVGRADLDALASALAEEPEEGAVEEGSGAGR